MYCGNHRASEQGWAWDRRNQVADVAVDVAHADCEGAQPVGAPHDVCQHSIHAGSPRLGTKGRASKPKPPKHEAGRRYTELMRET